MYLEKEANHLLIMPVHIPHSTYPWACHITANPATFQAIYTTVWQHPRKVQEENLPNEANFWPTQNRIILLSNTNFTLAIRVEQNIACLDISMYELGGVQVLQDFAELVSNKSYMGRTKYILPLLLPNYPIIECKSVYIYSKTR